MLKIKHRPGDVDRVKHQTLAEFFGMPICQKEEESMITSTIINNLEALGNWYGNRYLESWRANIAENWWCVFRGNPAGYSDGKRPPFRAKPATHSDGKAATFRPVVGKVAGMARKIAG